MKRRRDILLFLLILAIGSMSLLIISSISFSLFRNQIIFWGIGLIVLYSVSNFDYHNWLNYSYYFYFGMLLVLLLLLLLGEPIRGSTRWLELGIFRLQPSEIAKGAAILALATFFSHKSPKDFKNLVIGFLIILPAVVLIFFEPDIGNTFAFLAIWLGISYAAGMKLKHVVLLAAVTSVIAMVFFETLAPYQKERLSSFINPFSDPLGNSYNLIQSKIAVGSGQLFGKGYGHGSQSQLKFLPEAESDFIFASIAEQLGSLGAGLILVLFTWMIFRLVNFAFYSDPFGQLIIAGTVSYLLVQFIVNVGMNLGLLPVTGITLPLISYGGSSLVTNLFVFGAIFSIVRFNK